MVFSILDLLLVRTWRYKYFHISPNSSITFIFIIYDTWSHDFLSFVYSSIEVSFHCFKFTFIYSARKK